MLEISRRFIVWEVIYLQLFFNGPSPATFSIIFFISNKHYHFYNKYMWKMYIQYVVLGFEPTAFWKWVSYHNHQTRAPAYIYLLSFRSVKFQWILYVNPWRI